MAVEKQCPSLRAVLSGLSAALISADMPLFVMPAQIEPQAGAGDL